MADRRVIRSGDPWPEGVSDGLTLHCYYCACRPAVDYTVNDAFWEAVVPPEARRGVVCLDCLIHRVGPAVIPNIERLQVVAPGSTLLCRPEAEYVYALRQEARNR